LNLDTFREHCLTKAGVTEEFPFGPDTLVYKVNGKMFALTNVDEFDGINLKCDPEEAVMLREQYPAVQPGYHMNKKHWITVVMDGSISDKLIKLWTDQSYILVAKKTPSSPKKAKKRK
jgi:predicted DNA-binding protein (MmcQ/YjbR family)